MNDSARKAFTVCLIGLSSLAIAQMRVTYEDAPYDPNIFNQDQLKVLLTSNVDVNGDMRDISLISYEHLTRLFTYLASQSYIPFKYPENGCFARAHEMARLLDKRGIISQKVFLEGALRVETPNAEFGVTNFLYHTAIVLKASRNGVDSLYVIDPSLFDGPVTVAEWRDIQIKHDPSQPYKLSFSQRFNFSAPEKKLKLTDYRSQDLEVTYKTLPEFMKIQEARARKRGPKP